MKASLLLLSLLALAACTSTATPTAEPSPAPSPTATWTATAAPAATNTARPTDLPSPTHTASPAPSWTPTGTPEPTATATSEPTATPTVAPVAFDLATWELPLITAGVTLGTIGELEATAIGLQDGSLESGKAGGTLLGLQIVVVTVAQALDERRPSGQAARFEDDLQMNLRTVYGIIMRWQALELSSATVGPELMAARAASEQTLSELGRAAGLTPAQVAEFVATLDQ